MDGIDSNLKNRGIKSVFNLSNIRIVLVIFGLSGILFISGCVTPPEVPANCSAVNNNFTGCNISCSIDSDCKRTCCGCIDKNENCQTKLNGKDAAEEAACSLSAGDCKCINKRCVLQPPFNPDSIGNLSDIVESGPVDEKAVAELAGEDRVAFFFLHNPGCGHCLAAEKNLPEIQKMFGQRIIIYKLKVREPESLPWRNYAVNAGLSSYPFTLAVGARSFENGIINKSKIGMTSSSGLTKYEEWNKNICLQFKKPPSNCSKYMNQT